MMKYEYNFFISRGRGLVAVKDEESSFSKEITSEKAEAMKQICREAGFTEGKTSKTIWFSHIINSNESEEFIFYK